MASEIPRYMVWSTDQIELKDPFQRRWLLRQTLLHGRAEDIRRVDFDEIARELDHLQLLPEIDHLWRTYLEHRDDLSEHDPG
jgi:hypothetical protein